MKILLILAVASVLAGIGSLAWANTTVYIAVRTDGQPGTGTAFNPYDGSTEPKFDALMQNLGPNTTIHLAAGTYLTNGADGFQVKSGWTLEGAGMGQTILKLAPHASTNVKHENISGNYLSNVLIGNLTCDANYAGGHWPAHQAVGGIFLIGSNITVDHVEMINCYGDYVDWYEEFSILVCGSATINATNLTIEHCITHQYAPGADYTNGPSVAGCTNSQIIDCSDDGASHGFGSAGTSNTKITGCTTTFNTGDGFYMDTGALSNLTLEGNTFAASIAPIQISTSSLIHNIQIVDNTFKSTNSTGGSEAAVVLCGAGGDTIDITGNVFAYTGTNHAGLILNNQEKYTDLLVEDNSSNVGLVGGGGTTQSVTDVSTLSGNKFNESPTELSQDEASSGANNPDAAAAATTSATSTTSTTSPPTSSVAPATAANTVASPTGNSPTTKTIAATSSATPVQSLQQALRMAPGPAKTLLLRNILVSWVNQNPAAAATYVQSMADSPEKMSAVQFVAESWDAIDPLGAATWLAGLPDSLPTRAARSPAANRS